MRRREFSLHDGQQQTNQESNQTCQFGGDDPVIARFGTRVSGRRILLNLELVNSSKAHIHHDTWLVMTIVRLMDVWPISSMFLTEVCYLSAQR